MTKIVFILSAQKDIAHFHKSSPSTIIKGLGNSISCEMFLRKQDQNRFVNFNHHKFFLTNSLHMV